MRENGKKVGAAESLAPKSFINEPKNLLLTVMPGTYILPKAKQNYKKV